MKEQNKNSEKELNETDNQPIICRVQDTGDHELILKELIEYGNNIKEELKITLSEIKISREPTVKGRKPGFK